MSTAVTTAPQATGLKAFNQTITSSKVQDYLGQVLGEKKQGFVNNLTALVANSPMLQRCSPMGLMYAAIKATALDLPLDQNLGFAYVIPYNNRKEGTTEAQFQLGYKGFIQLAIRSGQFVGINATEVREGELEDFDLLTGKLKFKAKPNRHELKVVGYVAYFELTNGFSKSFYMSIEEVRAHRERFSKAKNSPWDSDFDAMAKKTVLKLLLSHYAPLSIQMTNAIQSDQASFNDEGQAVYIDNPQSASVEEVVAEEIAEHQGKTEFVEDSEDPENSEPPTAPF